MVTNEPRLNQPYSPSLHGCEPASVTWCPGPAGMNRNSALRLAVNRTRLRINRRPGPPDRTVDRLESRDRRCQREQLTPGTVMACEFVFGAGGLTCGRRASNSSRAASGIQSMRVTDERNNPDARFVLSDFRDRSSAGMPLPPPAVRHSAHLLAPCSVPPLQCATQARNRLSRGGRAARRVRLFGRSDRADLRARRERTRDRVGLGFSAFRRFRRMLDGDHYQRTTRVVDAQPYGGIRNRRPLVLLRA